MTIINTEATRAAAIGVAARRVEIHELVMEPYQVLKEENR